MNTGKLKTFAQQSRRILMEGVKQKLLYWGFNAKGEVTDEPAQVGGGVIIRGEVIDDPTIMPKWEALHNSIRKHGVAAVVEEAAYTWFNRMLAIRILGKNGYDAAQLEYEDTGSRLPVILARARRGATSFLNKNELARLQLFLTDYSQETRAFAILLTGYCHSHGLLNRVFGRLNDYTELLLPDNILAPGGFIHLLNTTDAIGDDDYRQVELIGWLYQFYISEKKDEVFAGFKKNQKARPEDIPAATQIFTPNWIVKYMVQNTAGRIWLDHHPDSKLKESMKYLVETPTEGESPLEKGGGIRQEGLQSIETNPSESPFSQGGRAPMKQPDLFSTSATSTQIPPSGGTKGGDAGTPATLLKNGDPLYLKLLDPACGSGHILVEGFALLYEMYMEEFYLPAEAVENILTKNLFGLELDLRAAQLARFAVLLAAAQKTPEILKKEILPRIYAMPEPVVFTRQEILDFLGPQGTQHEKVLTNALQLMQQAQNLGSVMQFNLTATERGFLKTRWKELRTEARANLTLQALVQKLEPYLNILFALTRRYEAIAANPPYMGQKNMNSFLKNYLNTNYPLSKSDLFAVFIDVMICLLTERGKVGCITLDSWMFKTSYEEFRRDIYSNYSIYSLAHLGWHIIGIAFSTAAMILGKNRIREGGVYTHLEIDDIDFNKNEPYSFPLKNNRYSIKFQDDFSKIPNHQIVYWMPQVLINIFIKGKDLNNFSNPKKGITTGDDSSFVRFWFEPQISKVNFNGFPSIINQGKWFPITKGGAYRKWYGNLIEVLEWENDGFNLKNFKDKNGSIKSACRNLSYNFMKGISWNDVSSLGFACRYTQQGVLMLAVGPRIFNSFKEPVVLSVLNSKVGTWIFEHISPGNKFEIGSVSSFPILPALLNFKENLYMNLTNTCINISKFDWDSSETSWDFNTTPLFDALLGDIGMATSQFAKSRLQSAIKDGALLQNVFKEYAAQWTNMFYQLHANEEELNRIFIEIYGLNEELDPVVPLKDITILQEELDRTALEETDKELRKQRQWKLEDGKWQLYINGQLQPPSAEGELPAATVQPALPIKKDVVARQLVSYAIGCMMGRYSLQKPGLILANQGETIEDYHRIINGATSPLEKGGGTPMGDGGLVERSMENGIYENQNPPESPFTKGGRALMNGEFEVDDDAIIPLMGTNCGFADDALYRLRHFIEVVWGSQSLTQNINFLQSCLDMELEKYLTSQNNFWKDHCSRYKKKPIYWLFSSPTGAFQVITYMHRMNRFTVQKIRDNYLLRHIPWLAGQISQLESRLNSLTRDELKRLDWFRKAQKECEAYNDYLKDIADRQTEFDLDDGVSVNYPKFEPVVAGIK